MVKSNILLFVFVALANMGLVLRSEAQDLGTYEDELLELTYSKEAQARMDALDIFNQLGQRKAGDMKEGTFHRLCELLEDQDIGVVAVTLSVLTQQLPAYRQFLVEDRFLNELDSKVSKLTVLSEDAGSASRRHVGDLARLTQMKYYHSLYDEKKYLEKERSYCIYLTSKFRANCDLSRLANLSSTIKTDRYLYLKGKLLLKISREGTTEELNEIFFSSIIHIYALDVNNCIEKLPLDYRILLGGFYRELKTRADYTHITKDYKSELEDLEKNLSDLNDVGIDIDKAVNYLLKLGLK